MDTTPTEAKRGWFARYSAWHAARVERHQDERTAKLAHIDGELSAVKTMLREQREAKRAAKRAAHDESA